MPWGGPVVLVVIADGATRAEVADALERRYCADYEVVQVAGPAELPDVLQTLSDEARIVALALAPMNESGAAALRAVSDRFPTARCIAIVEVGDTSAAAELNRALTLSAVNYYVGHPWATPEEELYPVTGEALRVWSRDQQLSYEKVTIVDAPDGRRGRQLATWLARNSVAATFHTSDSPTGAALVSGPLAGAGLPATLLYDGRVLDDPSEAVLAEALGANVRPSADRYDVTIVGAGPAGLAAAVYAAAEGLRTLVIEQDALGGQAGTSPKIRNYLGFRWGIGGGDLANEAARQAEQLGAELVMTRAATRLAVDGDDRCVTLTSGDVARAGAVILAGGVAYRQLGVASVDALVGRGVLYGAGSSETSAMGGSRVAVLGAGNSAAQAACALAAAGAEVTMLVRGASPATSMSDYLVQQVSGTPNITVRTGTQVVDAIGEHQLEGLVVTDGDGTTTIHADALFVFIGAQPHTNWLNGTVELDRNGFILAGRDLPERGDAAWLETSVPGVFAASDIRFGSIKRVAAAVGEGSTAAMLARDHLAG